MKPRRTVNIIIKAICFVAAILVVVSFAIPALSYGSGTTNIYFFEIAGISVSTSSASYGALAGVIILIVFLVGPALFATGKSETTKCVGYGLTLSAISWYFVVHALIAQSVASITSSSSTSLVTTYGDIILMVAIVFLLIAMAISAFDLTWGNKIEMVISSSQKQSSLETQLLELNELHDKKLISDQEFEEKRKAILNEK